MKSNQPTTAQAGVHVDVKSSFAYLSALKIHVSPGMVIALDLFLTLHLSWKMNKVHLLLLLDTRSRPRPGGHHHCLCPNRHPIPAWPIRDVFQASIALSLSFSHT